MRANPTDDLPRMLTVEQARNVLGIGRTKFDRLLTEGLLPFVRIGQTRRIRADDLRAFIDGLGPTEAAE